MKENLAVETEKLTRCWSRHEAEWLRDYLVAEVEDPRLNLQSILSRHFLISALAQDRFKDLFDQEYRFAAVIAWLLRVTSPLTEPEDLEVLQHALAQGSDNAEGMEIPQFVLKTYAELPRESGGVLIPNYLESFLTQSYFLKKNDTPHQPVLDTFASVWKQAL